MYPLHFFTIAGESTVKNTPANPNSFPIFPQPSVNKTGKGHSRGGGRVLFLSNIVGEVWIYLKPFPTEIQK